MGGDRIKSLKSLIHDILFALHQKDYKKASLKIGQLSLFDFSQIPSNELPTILDQIEYILQILKEHKEAVAQQMKKKEQIKKYNSNKSF